MTDTRQANQADPDKAALRRLVRGLSIVAAAVFVLVTSLGSPAVSAWRHGGHGDCVSSSSSPHRSLSFSCGRSSACSAVRRAPRSAPLRCSARLS